jgi:hypothetical protein
LRKQVVLFGVLKSMMTLCPGDKVDGGVLGNPGIPLPSRIQTVILKVLDLEFKVLDEII